MHVAQSTVASMIGVITKSINQELRLLRQQGIVEISEKKIVIRDMEMLRKKWML